MQGWLGWEEVDEEQNARKTEKQQAAAENE